MLLTAAADAAKFARVLERFEADPELRVIVLAGAGDKAFVSGADISQFESQRSGAEAVQRYEEIAEGAQLRLQRCDKPVLAMIRGYCLGAGVNIALACDLRIAAEDARFGIPAARMALGYRVSSTKNLVDTIGPARTREMLITARQYGAAEAERIGLVQRVVPAAAIEAEVLETCASIAANAISAWVIAPAGRSGQLVLARVLGGGRREQVEQVHQARHDEEEHDRVHERRVADLQHRGGVAVGGDLLRLVPHEVGEAEQEEARGELDGRAHRAPYARRHQVVGEIDAHMLLAARDERQPREDQHRHQDLGDLEAAGHRVVEQVAPHHVGEREEHHREQHRAGDEAEHGLEPAREAREARRHFFIVCSSRLTSAWNASSAFLPSTPFASAALIQSWMIGCAFSSIAFSNAGLA